MTPIISPWAFYAVSICGNLHNSTPLCMGVAIFLAFGCSVAYCGEEVPKKKIKPFLKVAIIMAALGTITGTFIPSREDATLMLAASVVTPDNIAAVQGNVVDFIGEVAKAIAAVKN